MTASELVRLIERDGARLSLTESGRLRITGDPVHVERWLGTVAQYEAELVAALQAGRATDEPNRCQHPSCETITLGRAFCSKHRPPEIPSTEKPLPGTPAGVPPVDPT